jgi:hypothetical protein
MRLSGRLGLGCGRIPNLPGIAVRVRDAQTFDDLGVVTVPGPIEPGDVIALEEGPPLRVQSVLLCRPGAVIAAAVTVLPVAMAFLTR